MSASSDRRGRATIEDVAAAAAVSVATVSRSLRGLPNVAKSTRDRVTDAATSLNYRPHPSASRLASGQTRIIEIAVPVLNSWYFSEVLAGAEAVLSECGYSLSISAVASPEEREKFIRDAVAADGADGLIMVDLPLDELEASVLAESRMRVVTAGVESGRFESVVVDNVEIGRKAVRHLFERGHRRIGILSGQSDDPLHFTVPGDRVVGYAEQLTSFGIEVDPALSCVGNFSVDGGKESMLTLLRLEDRPTAVFAISDEMAFGAMAAVRENQLSVPHDVAIIGVDGHDLSEVMGLTTIDQHVEDHGVMAARRLVEILEGAAESPLHLEIETTLVVRSST